MVDKEGTDSAKDAIKAYKAAREETDHSDEVAERDEVSSVLREKVRLIRWSSFPITCILDIMKGYFLGILWGYPIIVLRVRTN